MRCSLVLEKHLERSRPPPILFGLWLDLRLVESSDEHTVPGMATELSEVLRSGYDDSLALFDGSPAEE